MNAKANEDRMHTSRDVVYVCVDEARFNQLTTDLDTLRRVNARQSLAMATAGHDLRQHLQTMLLALDLVRPGLADPGHLHWLETAHEQAQCLITGLESLALESNINAYTFQHQRSSFPIATLLDRLDDKWSEVAKAKNLELRIDDSRVRVRSNAELLFAVVDNLVSNAIKHTRRGSVGVYASVEKNVLRVSVKDTGPGIAAENLEAIFEPYWRGSETHIGMGLGLAIVQSTASLLDHAVSVTSSVGRGTCFTVQVPLAEESFPGSRSPPGTNGVRAIADCGLQSAIGSD